MIKTLLQQQLKESLNTILITMKQILNFSMTVDENLRKIYLLVEMKKCMNQK